MALPEYNLPKNAYANFDATSLKSFMIEQLNDSGKFTDQNYEGSNISSLLDILAYYTHVLMFYLNQTASESMFSQTTIYENMNRIIKLIDYKPTGKQTSLTPIYAEASETLTPGNYFIKRYSYFLIDNIQYTFKTDYFFEKVSSSTEVLESLNENCILYQGTVNEYPIYEADGVEYETIPVVVNNIDAGDNDKFISHGTIDVYVKEFSNDKWYQYTESDNLYLKSSSDRVFDCRLNQNGNYEIKFGNGIFGKKLSQGDQVAIFYVLSDGKAGKINTNAINGNKLFVYNSSRFNTISEDIYSETDTVPISELNRNSLFFSNPRESTEIQNAETVDQIRENAPLFISNQLRLVTENDYEKYLMKIIPNILNDVKVVNNKLYVNEYIKYFYDICADPNKSNRVILNQVNFADTCDFNNVNVFCVPHNSNKLDEWYPPFLTESFKSVVLNLTEDKKIVTSEVVPRDPVYMAYDIGFSNVNFTKSSYNDTSLVIVKEKNTLINKDILKQKVSDIIRTYFNPKNCKLGQTIDINKIASDILSIEGIKQLRTRNNKENVSFNGISFVSWNPLYDGLDDSIVNQNTKLPYFKYPYFYRPNNLINKIDIIEE